MRRILVITIAMLGVLSACEPSGGPVINIDNPSPDDRLVLPDLLIFSSVKGEVKPARSVQVKNVGNETLRVNRMSVSDTTAFRLADSQPRSFDVAPRASRAVAVEFRPPQVDGKASYTASLFVETNDAAQPRDEVFLRGWYSPFYEGSGEPNRQEIVNTIGYRTTVGTDRPCCGTTGEEQLAPYWRRANPNRPVELVPIARYASRTSGPTGLTSWYPRGDAGATSKLYDFPGCNCADPTAGSGGENQRLIPGYTGNASFGPDGAFGLALAQSGENLYSDDALNGPGRTHTFRFWPARDGAGAVLPDTWIVGVDLGLDANGLNKNNDFQDYMFTLVNARPDGATASGPTAGPSPSSPAPAPAPSLNRFTDTDGNVHEAQIEAIADAGITGGCAGPADAAAYCPGDPVSRGQMASFLVRALELPGATADAFGDDDGNTHEDAINALADAGITQGTGGRSYEPDEGVQRDQMASFLDAAFDLRDSATQPFLDVTSGVHAASVNALAAAGITTGCDAAGTLYCPGRIVARDQMASFLARALAL